MLNVKIVFFHSNQSQFSISWWSVGNACIVNALHLINIGLNVTLFVKIFYRAPLTQKTDKSDRHRFELKIM